MRKMTFGAPRLRFLLIACVFLAIGAGVAGAQTTADGNAAQLAKKLSNPVSSLISVPFQYNHDSGLGAGDGSQDVLNIQPVIPFSISENWNLISRTIIPVISRDDVLPDDSSQFGLGNITQSFFFSPKAPTASGLIWGVGPVISIPTATDNLANKQWGLGVTGVALKQSGPWTIGFLGNHIWSVSDEDRYGSYSVSYLQPFVSYTTPTALSVGLNVESTFDWKDDQWTVPINLQVNQLVKLGRQPVQIGAGVRYWADAPEGGPEGWGARVSMVFLFPK